MFPKNAKCANPVFFKSYARIKPNGQRESWEETCNRTLAGLFKLGKFTLQQEKLIRSLQEKLITLPSGRWLWVGGTKWLEKDENYSGAFNCTSTVINDWKSFGLLMDLAMVGSGTGAVLEFQNIKKLPAIKNHLEVEALDNLGKNYLGENYLEETVITIASPQEVEITVGDSRQGWVKAYVALMEIASGSQGYEGLDTSIKVTVNLQNIRPQNTRLEGFGGVANPVKLPGLFERCAVVLNNAQGRQLEPVECCLLIDEAAMTVVAGNIRRCIAAQSRVSTSEGLKKIEDVQIGDLVLTGNGTYCRVINKFDQGVQEVVELRTANAKLRCTKRHKLAIFQDYEQYSWKRVEDLEWEDELIAVRHSEGYLLPDDMKWLEHAFPWSKTNNASYYPVKCFDANKVGFAQTYDLEVEGRHEFVCEGLLVSNSAGMRQFNQNDEAAKVIKLDLWQQDEGGNWQIDPKRDALRMANHTLVFHRQPTYEEILNSVSLQYKCGEGAIQWAAEAIARSSSDILPDRATKNRFIQLYKVNPDVARRFLQILSDENSEEIDDRMSRYGLNPCGEVLGNNFHCNLAEIQLNQINPCDIRTQEQAFEAGALIVCALLNKGFVEERYQKAREADPIVAVSFTGLFDFFVNYFGVDWLRWWQAGRPDDWGKVSPELQSQMSLDDFLACEYLSDWFRKEERRFLQKWRNIVEATVEEYCTTHKIKVPNRCTTVQPSGTKSLLTNACPGWHPPKAIRFIRRITFAKGDPIALACIDYGYNVIPSQSSKDEQGNLLNDPFDHRCDEWLVEIPCATSWADLPGADEIDISKFSALAQLDFCMTVQKNWTTHNTSSTIEMVESEIEPVAEKIYQAIVENEGYVSATLLAKFYDKETFPRLPFEPITKDEYERLTQEVLSRRITDDFYAAINHHTPKDYQSNDLGAAPCDSDKCLMSEVKP